MSTRDVIAFSAIPLVLLVSAWLIDCYSFWSRLANVTLPWLCSAVAVAMLILGATCAVMQCSPAELRRSRAVAVVAGTLIVFGAGMAVDFCSYWSNTVPQRADHERYQAIFERYASETGAAPSKKGPVERLASHLPDDWLSSVGEWIGFGLILAATFVLPRGRDRRAHDTPT